MLRLLRELDRLDAGSRPRTGLRPLVRRAAATTALLGILGAGVLTFLRVEYGVTVGADGFTQARPLGQPPITPKGVGTFAFSQHQVAAAGDPVAYDPCRKLQYAFNTDLSPVGGTELVEQAVRRVERATGLVFERMPDTSESPDSDHGLSLPLRRDPVVIGWTTPEAVPELAGPVAGLGGSSSREHTSTGGRVYTTGIVALDAPQLTELMARPGGLAQTRAIVMHELGHLVGLDHVDDPHELMHADNVGLTTFGPGDREGLAALGAGQCFH